MNRQHLQAPLRRHLTVAAIALALGIAAVTAGTVTASAHAVVNVGPYYLAIGWADEPAYVGQPNTIQVFVRQGTVSGAAVSNLQPGALKVQVTAPGGITSAQLPLQPAFDPDTHLGDPSLYIADMIPTVPGNYTFHVTGSIDGTPVNVTRTSGGDTFAPVTDPSSGTAEFPVSIPSSAQQATLLTQLEQRVQSADSAAQAATNSEHTAYALAIAALVVALLAALTAVMAWRRRPLST